MSTRGEIVWSPGDGAWEKSRLADFARHLRQRGGPAVDDYEALLEWSLAQPGPFWAAIAEWAHVRWHDEPIADLADPAMPGAVWFPGGTLNYAEQALRPWWTMSSAEAVVSVSQTRGRRSLDAVALVDRVARCRAGLRRLGVSRGDRVVAYAPNIDETLVAFLATASLGAVWSSCAPEFGVRAVTDRWSQIEPKVLLAVDGYMYGDRAIDRRQHVSEIVDALPSLDHVVRIPYLDPAGPDDWSPLLARHEPQEFEPVPFDHPLYVLFSSGTTGLPKPIVHGHGGIVLEHLKALTLHYDLAPGDRFSWFTTTGWMMWNLLVSGLLTGATTVLFDGDPASPGLDTLWRLADDERLSVAGVSAPFVMACRKAGLQPGSDHDLRRLRHLGSTGAPLPPEGFRWVRDSVGAGVQVGSLSGGTDVCTGFVGPAPTLPVRAGEITTRMLGCDVQAFTPSGDRCRPGQTGELVITAPMPSMPVGFWGDESGERLRDAYFAEFPGVWHHGDWITFHDDGACIITGRSDATLNRGGVRLGTSDFYTVVESLDRVQDSLVVHLDDESGGLGELVLLVSCPPGTVLDDTLRTEIVETLRRELSPRHVPDTIAELRVIPRTLSGKKLEVPVKRMLQGAPAESVASRDSLADPTALDVVATWIEQRGRP
jgi:acetoacetyl-CoA synthetase